MSTAPIAERGTADEGLAPRKLVAIGLFALTVFAASVVIAAMLLSKTTTKLAETKGPPNPVAKAGSMEVGIVNQELFTLDNRARDHKRQKLEHLSSYGWIDRDKGIAHIPIDEAMRTFVERSRAEASPAAAPPAPSAVPPATGGHP